VVDHRCITRGSNEGNAKLRQISNVLQQISQKMRYLSVNSPELIFDLANAKPGTNHSTNPTNPNGNSKQ